MNSKLFAKAAGAALSCLIIMMITSSCGMFMQGVVYENIDKDMDPADYQLLYSISDHNVEGIKEAIEDGAHLDDIEYSGTRFSRKDRSSIGLALELADGRTNNDLVHMLIDAGADVNGSGVKYKIPYILYAAGIRDSELMDLLIDNGADVNVKGKFPYRMTPLTALLSDKTLSVLSRFEDHGEIYLSRSDIADYEYMINTLLDHGIESTRRDLKCSLESMARITSAPIILEALKKKGIKSKLSPALESIIQGDSKGALETLDTVKKKEQENVLLFASAFGNKKLLSKMTEAGYDFDVEVKLFGGTIRPVEIAAAFNDLDSLEYICSKIKDPFSIMPYEERTLLTYAIEACSDNTVWLSGKVGFSVGDQLKQEGDRIVYDFVAAAENGNFDALKAMKGQNLEPSKKELGYAYDGIVSAGNVGDLNRFHDMGYEMPVGNEDDTLTESLTEDNEECISKVIDWGAYVSPFTIQYTIESGSDMFFDKVISHYMGKLNIDMLGDAIREGRLHAVKALVKAGQKVEVPYGCDEYDHPTMVHYAAVCPSARVLEYLLSACDDPDKIKRVKDNKGRTPYDLAEEAGFKKNMAVLSE